MSDNSFNHKLVKKLIHAEKTEALKGLLKELDSVEIANSLLQLKLKHQLLVLENLSKEVASEVLAHLQNSSPILEGIVSQMNSGRLGEIIEEMDGDDAADMVSILEESKAEEVLETLPTKDREEITNLMQYHEESAGGIMNPVVVSVGKDQTVKEAVNGIRDLIEKEELETFYAVYVVDEYQHLIGMVTVPILLLAEQENLIKNLMNPNVVAVDVDMDQEAVARIAQEYDLVVIPVIDKYLKLIGRITIDDLMDVLHEEYHEDIAHIAGTGGEEVLETSVLRTSRDRLPWLILGLGGGFLAALAMSEYESMLTDLPQVMYFMPLIAALGGNIAIQSSSIVVRGLGTGEIRTGDLLQRLWKELRVGMLNGPVCALILFLMVWTITTDVKLGMITGIALIAVVMLAASVGSTIPILLKRINIDPAIATGPFITTANDLLGILIYLSVTFSILGTSLI
ncbi:MAG: magnesium transporter [SAR324 cluster bacterium]|nr:magnesium transporter [SAR324 cluster bacterium]